MFLSHNDKVFVGCRVSLLIQSSTTSVSEETTEPLI